MRDMFDREALHEEPEEAEEDTDEQTPRALAKREPESRRAIARRDRRSRAIAEAKPEGPAHQETVDALRFAAVVISGLGGRLVRDPDLGVTVVALPGGQFVDDQFVVECFRRSLRELDRWDPEIADDLRAGRPIEWVDTSELDDDALERVRVTHDFEEDFPDLSLTAEQRSAVRDKR